MTKVKDNKPEIIRGTSSVLKSYIKATRNERKVVEASNNLRDYILSKANEAILRLYKEDIFLLKEKMNEVTICGRIAMYLQDFFKGFKGYYVDIEYYRLTKPKEEADLRTDRIRCDILLHSRCFYERRVDNLLAIEVKLEKSHDDGESDMKRLADFVTPERPDTSSDAVHSTLVGLFLRLDEQGYSSGLFTPQGYTQVSNVEINEP